MDFKLEGIEEFDKLLNGLGKTVQKRVANKAVRVAASVIRKEIKHNAPDGSRENWDAKKGLITLYEKRAKIKNSIIIKKMRSKESYLLELKVGIAKEAYHAMFYEFGTRDQPPRPFVRPAFEAKKEEALQKMGEVFGKETVKEAQKMYGGSKK